MGWFLKGIIGITLLVIVAVVLSPSGEEKAQELLATLDEIADSQAADISPTGRLAELFSFGSDFTDIQRERATEEITGKIVQWTLPVYEVSQRGESYRVKTSAEQTFMGVGTPMVGAFITVYPRNDNERTYIENLKTGDSIAFKGKIVGTRMRNITIEPAILVSR